MTDDKKVLLIPKIENGIVIDHVPAGFGLAILEVIHAYPEMKSVVVTVGLNYTSNRMGKKDMLKLATDDLPPRVLHHVAMICPGVTIKRIKNYRVEGKFVVTVPEEMVGQARCKNPSCVTNHERDVTTHFRCVDTKAKRFLCVFCERVFPLNEIEFRIP